jgi:hypothetical protein
MPDVPHCPHPLSRIHQEPIVVKSQPIYYAGQTIRTQIADQARVVFNIILIMVVVALIAFAYGASRGGHGGEPKNAPECTSGQETTGGACYG